MGLRVRPMTLGVLVWICVALTAEPTLGEENLPAVSQGKITFVVDAAGFKGPTGRTHEEVYYVFTTDQLLLVKGNGGYRGSFEVNAILYDSDGGDAARRRIERSVVIDSASYGKRNQRVVLDQLALQVEAGQYELVLKLALFPTLTPIGKQNFLLRFWRNKDPTPGTPENEFMIEHFRRMAYAEKHFTGHKGGINTDMGRVYIVYGPPEEIEQDSRETKAYEIWYYILKGKEYFVFVDQTGAGIYELVHSSVEGEIHNPYRRDEVWR